MKRLLMILALPILVSCATRYNPDIDYKLDYDFAALNTFALIQSPTPEQANDQPLSKSVSSLDNDRIASAITRTLGDKGLTSVSEEQADTLVRFKLITQEKQEIRTYTTGIHHCWYCRPFYDRPFYDRPHAMQEIRVRNYTEGTLIIDMVDPNTQKSVWRSVVSEAVRKNIPVEEKQARIQALVSAMLADFKPPMTSQP